MSVLSKALGSVLGKSGVGEILGKGADIVGEYILSADEKADMQKWLDAGQMKINLAEASHKSIFVAGWRPFIGWVCVFGLGYQYVFAPILGAILALFGSVAILPVLDMAVLFPLVTSLLGIGGMRSWEKWKGVNTK
mgnify:CR=1 FL=1|jgi:hypothetical protein